MYNKAFNIIENSGTYNLWNHNCNQVAQTILSAGGKDFATTDFDWWNTRPNSVRDILLEKTINVPLTNGVNIDIGYNDKMSYMMGKNK